MHAWFVAVCELKMSWALAINYDVHGCAAGLSSVADARQRPHQPAGKCPHSAANPSHVPPTTVMGFLFERPSRLLNIKLFMKLQRDACSSGQVKVVGFGRRRRSRKADAQCIVARQPQVLHKRPRLRLHRCTVSIR